ncbi:MAG: hypothetical protein Q9195_007150 [Heterodermia aff. obscurata]
MFDRGSLDADTSCLKIPSQWAANICGKLVEASSQVLDAGKQWAGKMLKGESTEEQEPDAMDQTDPLEKFASVRANIDLTIIQEYASCVRRSRVSPKEYVVTPWVFECTTTSSPLHGSFNILFPLVFGDGVQWLFKVPARGYNGCWDDMAARALTSEALTMRYLRQNIIPVPEVYSFDSSVDNALGCPFILMEHVHGRRLYEGWFGAWSSGEYLESFRQRCLQTLALNMAKVGALRFPNGGTLAYDSTNAVSSIKPTRVLDYTRMSDNIVEWQSGTEELDNNYYFREIGPFNSEENEIGHLLSLLEDHEPRATKFGEGIYQLLKLFVDWFPREESENPFVILHPDLDLQNVLVDDNGAVVSLIDWDGVATASRSIGCAYPKWLTHDWDPWNYVYHSGQPDRWGHNVQSPKELKRYREMYTNFFQQATLENNGPISTSDDTGIVRKSLLIGSLKLAMENSQSTDDIVIKIYDLIAQITGQKTFQVDSGSTLRLENAYDVSSLEADGVKPETSTSEQNETNSATSSQTTGSTEEIRSTYTRASTPPTEVSSKSSIFSTNPHSNPAVDEAVHPMETAKDPPVMEKAMDLASHSSQQGPLLKKKAKALRTRSCLPVFSRAWSSMTRSKDTKYEHTGTTGLSVMVDGTMFEIVNPRNTGLDSPAHNSKCFSTERTRGAATHEGTSQHRPSETDLGESSSTRSSKEVGSSSEFPSLGNPRGLASDHTANSEILPRQTINTTATQLVLASDPIQQIEPPSEIKEQHIPSPSTTAAISLAPDIPAQTPQKATAPHRRRRLVKKQKPTGSETTSNDSSSSKSRTKRITTWLKTVVRAAHPKNETSSSRISPLPDRPSSESKSASEAQDSTSTSSSDHHQTISPRVPGHQPGTNSVVEDIPCPPGTQKFDLDKLEFVDDDQLYEQRFLPSQVCEDLVDGTLDEERMRRLRRGFEVLVDSL